jgi:hypothetical protein
MPNIAPAELIELDSLFRPLFPCYGETDSLFGRARELVRNVVKLLRNPTIGTAKWRPNRQFSLIITLFAGKSHRPRAAVTSLTASSLAHSAGPAREAISQPLGSTRRVVGMPIALPIDLRSWNTLALGSA